MLMASFGISCSQIILHNFHRRMFEITWNKKHVSVISIAHIYNILKSGEYLNIRKLSQNYASQIRTLNLIRDYTQNLTFKFHLTNFVSLYIRGNNKKSCAT
jgi:hypothetical protein